MTDLKFSILEKLYYAERRQMPRYQLLNAYKEDGLINEAQHALIELDEDGLVKAPLQSDNAQLTKLGRVALESVREERKHQEECKQRELNAEQRALKSEQLATESNALAAESNRISIESNRLTKRSNIITVISIIVAILSIAVAIIQFFK